MDLTWYELGKLAERVRAATDARARLDEQLVRTSEAGATLEQLGEQLGGISPQAARSRLISARARSKEQES